MNSRDIEADLAEVEQIGESWVPMLTMNEICKMLPLTLPEMPPYPDLMGKHLINLPQIDKATK